MSSSICSRIWSILEYPRIPLVEENAPNRRLYSEEDRQLWMKGYLRMT